MLQPSCRKNGIGYEEVFIDEMASLEVTDITPGMLYKITPFVASTQGLI